MYSNKYRTTVLNDDHDVVTIISELKLFILKTVDLFFVTATSELKLCSLNIVGLLLLSIIALK